MDEERPIEDELRELTAAVREHVLWQKRLGAWGLPPAPPGEHVAPHAEAAERISRQELAQIEVQESVPSRPPPAHRPEPPRIPPPAPARVVPPPRAPAFAVPSDPQERIARLQTLLERTQACSACPLHEKRKQAVFARGNPAAELMFVGEGPGADEDAQGEPFVGRAGQLLDKMIQAIGFSPDQVYICNVVKCRPPENRTPEDAEMAACMPYLHEQIALVGPKVMVALGGTAARGLLGTTEGITRIRGTWKLYKASIPVMPTFHPAYLLRNEAAKRDVWQDLKAVVQQLGKTLPERKR